MKLTDAAQRLSRLEERLAAGEPVLAELADLERALSALSAAAPAGDDRLARCAARVRESWRVGPLPEPAGAPPSVAAGLARLSTMTIGAAANAALDEALAPLEESSAAARRAQRHADALDALARLLDLLDAEVRA